MSNIITRYRVIDLQGMDFMSDTYDEPEKWADLKNRFYSLYMNEYEDVGDPVKYEDFTKEFIEDLWEVEIKPIKFKEIKQNEK